MENREFAEDWVFIKKSTKTLKVNNCNRTESYIVGLS